MLPKNHPVIPKITRNLKNRRKGYTGEKDSDYYAKLLDPKTFFILHDLCLTHNKLNFQIDTLLLTTRFITVVEIKTLSGDLFFKEIQDSSPFPITKRLRVETIPWFRH
ncbi:nuclease-related domain-containing protein [Bacillus sp. B-jedd]|uniref:nuclease-related domain-containing protein n=1 Tax=Bacillus sp. B-jedd TaxID=1476857 RepID=UPI003FA44D1E